MPSPSLPVTLPVPLSSSSLSSSLNVLSLKNLLRLIFLLIFLSLFSLVFHFHRPSIPSIPRVFNSSPVSHFDQPEPSTVDAVITSTTAPPSTDSLPSPPSPPAEGTPPLSSSPSVPANASVPVTDLSSVEAMERTINYSQVWMSKLEIHVALTYLTNVNTYLEWGSGGSTMNFAPFGKVRSVSFEHDDQWCAKLRAMIANNTRLEKLEYYCIPKEDHSVLAGFSGDATHWDGSYINYRNYVDGIEKYGLGESGNLFDFVLVDGRSRVDCAIRALSFIGKHSVVVMHDASRVWDIASGKTSYYYPVTEFYRVLEMVVGEGKQGILVMQRKEKFAHLEGNHAAVRDILLKKYAITE